MNRDLIFVTILHDRLEEFKKYIEKHNLSFFDRIYDISLLEMSVELDSKKIREYILSTLVNTKKINHFKRAGALLA